MCTAGPASGQEFELTEDEITIGRANDATISVPDTSVSRKHALVRRAESGWALSDLNSGNGTMVNGEVIGDEVALAPGDVIVLGDTQLEYADDSQVAAIETVAPAPRRPPVRTARAGGGGTVTSRRPGRGVDEVAAAAGKRRRLGLIAVTALIVLLAGFVGARAIGQKQDAEAARKQAAADAQRKELAGAFQEAKSMIKEGQWAEAKARLEQIAEFDPEYEKKSIAQYLERATNEIPNERALAEAKVALGQGELGQAASALGRVKNTMQEKKLTELNELLAAKVGEKVADARKRLQTSPRDIAAMEAVKAMADDIIAARPDDRDGPELKRQAEDNIFRVRNPNVPVAAPETPHLEVQQRFRAGDLSGAMSLAQACAAKSAQCRALEAQIRDYQAKSKNLENMGWAELKSLYVLDKKIAGGSASDLSKQLRVRLATVSFKEASNAKTMRDWVTAHERAKLVLEVDPGHPGATALITEARSQAHEIYLRGYQLRETSPDEAARLFKEVLAMTPADDMDHQKAKSRLEEIERQ